MTTKFDAMYIELGCTDLIITTNDDDQVHVMLTRESSDDEGNDKNTVILKDDVSPEAARTIADAFNFCADEAQDLVIDDVGAAIIDMIKKNGCTHEIKAGILTLTTPDGRMWNFTEPKEVDKDGKVLKDEKADIVLPKDFNAIHAEDIKVLNEVMRIDLRNMAKEYGMTEEVASKSRSSELIEHILTHKGDVTISSLLNRVQKARKEKEGSKT